MAHETAKPRAEERVIYFNGVFGGPGEGRLPDCPSTCRITYEEEEVPTASAVVWNEAGELTYYQRPTPKTPKPPGQKWIYSFFFEPPNRNWDYEVLKRRETAWLDLRGIVDWTMSFHPESDFLWPSARLVPLDPERRIDTAGFSTGSREEAPRGWASRPKLLLALVSNCEGERMELLHELQDHFLPGLVDIFGDCGSPSPCSGRDEGDSCHQWLFSQYRFYAAFENKRFRGYISEKLFRGLLEGMVPLAAGGLERSDYEALGVPKEAIVHVDDFNSTRELASFLKGSGDDGAFQKYFSWHQDLRVASPLETRRGAFCDLCKELHKPPGEQRPRRTFGRDLVSWWFDQPEGPYVNNGSQPLPGRRRSLAAAVAKNFTPSDTYMKQLGEVDAFLRCWKSGNGTSFPDTGPCKHGVKQKVLKVVNAPWYRQGLENQGGASRVN